MAETTEAEEQREERQPFVKPDIPAIAALIANEGAIHHGETKAQRAAADNAKLYTKIEKDHHGSKDAAKLARRLVKMGRAASDDFMRTFEMLADHFELWPAQDLVDEAQGATGRRVGVRGDGAAALDLPDAEDSARAAGPDDDDGDGDGDDEHDLPGDPPEVSVEAKPDKVTPFRSALDAGKAHMQGGTKPDRKPRGAGAAAATTH